MTKKIFWVLLMMLSTQSMFAQNGIVKGILTEDYNGNEEPLPFANVFLEGTTTGTTTDFDGNFQLSVIEGTHVLVFSFMGYETVKQTIEITDGGELSLSVKMKAEGVAIEGVVVVAKMNRESEMALMMEQKEASIIKESIGAKELSTMGVSDAAGATSKISGVNQSEGSGDIYIRGLGDRYLYTTMNGLPIPSDDVEKKNIDLNLFSTQVIQNVGISKTYSVDGYADQTSGIVDISSKTSTSKNKIIIATGANSNVLSGGMFNNFKATQNNNDLTMGFYNRPYETTDAITSQSWNTTSRKVPLNYGFSFIAGTKVSLFSRDLSIFGTLSHTGKSEYQTGIFKKYRSNVLDQSFSDVENFEKNINTTALVNLEYDLSATSTINFNSLWIFKTTDNLYESGRNGEGYVFDQDPSEDSAFVRDQNVKTTQLVINQLLGSHEIGTKHKLKWGAAYNFVNADEPNRIRNEVNYYTSAVQFAHVGDYQQRKSEQLISDDDLNGFVNDEYSFLQEENQYLKLKLGGNARYKTRDFTSQFVGVRAKGQRVESIDNLDEALLDQDLYDSGDLIIRERKADTYNARLGVYAGFANFGFQKNKFSGTLGLRYEVDNIDVEWNVGNYVGRDGEVAYTYNNVLPSLNLKYQLTERNALRFASSKSITLPEFKELAPFEYLSPTGRVIKGNPDLISSENYNFDLKWEFFPKAKELFSVSGFYKMINDPINLALTRGSSGYFYYANTGNVADVYGFELEGKFFLMDGSVDQKPSLKFTFNATKMWFSQDLLEDFQYNNKTESGLQGASDLIANAALTFSTNSKKEFIATVSANYSSDKIFALGGPEDKANSATMFNSDIVEKGFVSLDLILSQKINDRIVLRMRGKNLLNPAIEQTQEIVPLTGAPAFNDVVMSYNKGVYVGIGLSINLN